MRILAKCARSTVEAARTSLESAPSASLASLSTKTTTAILSASLTPQLEFAKSSSARLANLQITALALSALLVMN